MKEINVMIFGNSSFALSLAKTVLVQEGFVLKAIVTQCKEYLPLNSIDMKAFSEKRNIECIEVYDINSKYVIEKVKTFNISLAICAWSKLIKKELINSIPFIIGTHPSKLPYNRGRHPLHWFLCLNIRQTTLTFFKLNEYVDDGQIIYQKQFHISERGDINDFNEAMNEAGVYALREILNSMKNKQITMLNQDGKEKSYFRKRNFFDTLLDLRMTKEDISNHVKSFCKPYLCSTLIIDKTLLHITHVKYLDTQTINPNNIIFEYGKVIDITNKSIDVKVIDGFMRLYFDKHDFVSSLKNISYIYSPSYYIMKYHNYFREILNDYI